MPTGAIVASSGAAHARYLETKSFCSLDGLRAVAILAVLWHHSLHEPEPDFVLAGRGFLGVDLFFVLSGFLITTLLLRERRRTGRISLRRFYVRRVLRIFPPYYLMLVIVGLLAYLTHGDTTAGLRHDLPYALAYVSNLATMQSLLGITWSLSAEEQFYLVVPPLEKYARKQLLVLLPLAYVLVSLPPFGCFSSWSLPSFFRQTTFGPIILGVILAHALDNPTTFAWFSRLLQHRLAPIFTAALVLVACAHPARDISGWPRVGIHFSLVLLVASCVVPPNHVLQFLLCSRPLRRIGVVSYGMYLYHMLVRHVVDKAAHRLGLSSALAYFVALLAITWAIAELSYRLYESRFLAMKARFSS